MTRRNRDHSVFVLNQGSGPYGRSSVLALNQPGGTFGAGHPAGGGAGAGQTLASALTAPAPSVEGPVTYGVDTGGPIAEVPYTPPIVLAPSAPAPSSPLVANPPSYSQTPALLPLVGSSYPNLSTAFKPRKTGPRYLS